MLGRRAGRRTRIRRRPPCAACSTCCCSDGYVALSQVRGRSRTPTLRLLAPPRACADLFGRHNERITCRLLLEIAEVDYVEETDRSRGFEAIYNLVFAKLSGLRLAARVRFQTQSADAASQEHAPRRRRPRREDEGFERHRSTRRLGCGSKLETSCRPSQRPAPDWLRSYPSRRLLGEHVDYERDSRAASGRPDRRVCSMLIPRPMPKAATMCCTATRARAAEPACGALECDMGMAEVCLGRPRVSLQESQRLRGEGSPACYPG